MSLYLHIISTPTLLNDLNYVGFFHIDRSTSEIDVINLLADTSMMIKYVSVSAMAFLDIHQSALKYVNLPLSILLPELYNAENPLDKMEVYTSIYVPEFKDFNDNIFKHKQDEKTNAVNCNETLTQEVIRGSHHLEGKLFIEPLIIKSTTLIGYNIKFVLENHKIELEPPQRTEEPDIGFYYDEIHNRYVVKSIIEGRLKSNSAQYDMHSMLSRSTAKEAIIDDKDKIYKLKDIIEEFNKEKKSHISPYFQGIYIKGQQILVLVKNEVIKDDKEFCHIFEKLLKKQKIGYGSNVRTCRLIKDMIEDVDENSQPFLLTNMDGDLDGVTKKGKSTIDKRSAFLLSSNIKGRKSLENMLVQGKKTELNWIILCSYMTILMIFVLSIVNYVYVKKFFDEISKRINLINISYQRVIYQQIVMFNAREIIVLKE